MSVDLFKFWSEIDPADKIHPADRAVFKRVAAKEEGFNLECLPGSFYGPLKTAKVVLLYLSPGFSKRDIEIAKSPTERQRIHKIREGNQPLSSQTEHGSGHRWWASRTRCFGVEEDIIRHNVAVLNIGAYHSKSFVDHELLAALPSSRMSLTWAQEVLFPEAVAGKRVVVCLRSARFWGLQPGTHYKKSLFAPNVNRAGHMLKDHMRDKAIKAVRVVLREA